MIHTFLNIELYTVVVLVLVLAMGFPISMTRVSLGSSAETFFTISMKGSSASLYFINMYI